MLTILLLFSNFVFSQEGDGQSCTQAKPLCDGTSFPSVSSLTTGPLGPDYGCLPLISGGPLSPTWFYVKVGSSGDLELTISKTDDATGSYMDVDYIIWGPYVHPSVPCKNNYEKLDAAHIIDCSAAVGVLPEVATITGATTGQYYILLVSSPNIKEGTIVLNQTGGTGSTDCSVLCNANLGEDTALCNEASYTLSTEPVENAIYSWYKDNVLLAGQTSNTLVVTETGLYKVNILVDNNILDDCDSSDEVNITFLEVDIAPPQTVYNYCQGNPIPTLSASNTSGTIYWYDMSYNLLATGDTFTPSSPGSYIVRAENTPSCTSDEYVVSVIEQSLPVITSDGNQEMCAGGKIPALSVTTNGTMVYWYDSPTSTVVLGTGTSFVPSGPGNYWAESTTDKGCMSGRIEIVLTENTLPSIASNGNQEMCPDDPIPTLSVTTNGTEVLWYDLPTSTTPIGTGTSFVPSGPGSYWAESTSDKGCASTRIEIQLIENPLPNIISDGDQIMCVGDSVPSLNVTTDGTIVYWYDSAISTTPISMGTTFTPPAPGSYWAEAVSDKGCVSERVEVNLYENPLPVITSDGNQEMCAGGTIPALSVTTNGTMVYWYDSPTSIVVLGTGTSFVPSGPGNYWAESTTDKGCMSGRIEIVLTENTLPSIASNGNQEMCPDDPIPTLSVTTNGTEVLWYDLPTSTTPIGTGTSFVPSGPGSYWAESTSDKGCASTRIEIQLIENPLPNIISDGDQIMCVGDSVPSLNVTTDGTIVYWYDSAISTTPISMGTTFTPPAPGSYWAEAVSDKGCVSERVEVKVTLGDVLSITSNGDESYCEGSLIPPLSVTTDGTEVLWYDSPTAVIPIGTSTSFTPSAPGSYWVQATNSAGCKSPKIEILLTEYPKPTLVLVGDNLYCAGEEPPTLEVTTNGTAVYWYDSPTSNTPIATGITYTPAVSGSYWAQSISGKGCYSDRLEIVVTENPLPTIVSDGDKEMCQGDPIPALSVTTNGTTVYWYDSPISTVVLGIGISFIPPIAGSYWAQAMSEESCYSERIELKLINNPQPIITSNGDQAICIGNPMPELSVNTDGEIVYWYDSITATNPIHTGLTFTPPTAGSYWTEALSDKACKSDRLEVKVIENLLPTLTVITDGMYCQGGSIPTLEVSTNGTVVYWYDSSTATTPIATGNSFTPTVEGSYWVAAESSASCTSNRMELVVEALPLPDAVIHVAYTEWFVGQTLELSADPSDSYRWTGPNGFVATEQTVYLDLESIQSTGVYQLETYTEQGCSNTETVNIVVFPNVEEALGEDQYLCNGDYTMMYPDIPGFIYMWEGVDSDQNMVTVEESGDYKLMVTTSEGNTSEGEITIEFSDLTITDVGIEGCSGYISLYATGGVEPYEYSIDGYQWQANPMFTTVPAGTYPVYVRDAKGCVYTSEPYTFEEHRITQAFSPNGDGINDYWDLSDLSACKNVKINIIDRYGRPLKHMDVNNLKWDGTFNGKPMLDGTYWFVIEFNDGYTSVYKSHVTIKRRTD